MIFLYSLALCKFAESEFVAQPVTMLRQWRLAGVQTQTANKGQ